MTWSAWLPLALVCLLGAMSPGPSLAVVARHAFRGGVRGWHRVRHGPRRRHFAVGAIDGQWPGCAAD